MTPTVLTRVIARLLYAPIVVVAVAVLVKGYVDVGDGFAAGVILSLGILLQMLAFGHERTAERLRLEHAPKLALAGLAVVVAVAIVPWLAGEAFLQHAPGPGEEPLHIGTLELLTAFAFDVGIFLLVVGALVAIIETLAGFQLDADGEPPR